MIVTIQVCPICYYWPINGEENEPACKQCGHTAEKNIHDEIIVDSATTLKELFDSCYVPLPMPTTKLPIPMEEFRQYQDRAQMFAGEKRRSVTVTRIPDEDEDEA